MAARRTSAASHAGALNALLSLSGSLTRTKTGGVFSEALTAVLEGTGLHHGVVHEVTAEGLELVAEENLPAQLREHIGAFPSADSPWFVIAQAARRRRMLVEEDAAAMFGSRVPRAVVRNSGWASVAAAPILIGRDVLGVITIAAASEEVFTPDVLAVLEVAANMLALSLARERAAAVEPAPVAKPHQVSDVDEKLTRLATLGSLTMGYADDLRAMLSQLETQLGSQSKWLQEVRVRRPQIAHLVADLEPLLEESASALQLARASGARLFSAFGESSAEIVDLASLAQEVVALIEPVARAQHVDVILASPSGADASTIGKRSELRQLVQGLVTDGIDALSRPDKPNKQPSQPAQKPIVSIVITREKNLVTVVIEHSGKGSSTEHRRTTALHTVAAKEPLGLMLARNITAAHSGTLEHGRSELGGSLIRVVLPAVPQAVVSKRAAAGPASSKRSRNSAAADAAPMTKRYGWTGKPNSVNIAAAKPIRAPMPSGNGPNSEVDTLASTERMPGTETSDSPPVSRPPASIIFGNADSAKITVVVPPSTKKRTGRDGPASSRPKS